MCQAVYVQNDFLCRSERVQCWLSRLQDGLCVSSVGARYWNVLQSAVQFRVDCFREIPISCPSVKTRNIKKESRIFDNKIQSRLSVNLAVRTHEK